jgi:hypothetical protein
VDKACRNGAAAAIAGNNSPRLPVTARPGGAFPPRDHEDEAMRSKMIIAAALLLVTALGGCVAYPGYGYNYGYQPRYYAAYPGNYAYQYPPYYTSDYNGYANTYRTINGGAR